MKVLAVALFTFAGILIARFVHGLYRREVRYRWRVLRRSTHPRAYWRRIAILGIAALLTLLGATMTILSLAMDQP